MTTDEGGKVTKFLQNNYCTLMLIHKKCPTGTPTRHEPGIFFDTRPNLIHFGIHRVALAGNPKCWVLPYFGRFGGTKNGTSGAQIKILRPLFNRKTKLAKNIQNDLFRAFWGVPKLVLWVPESKF